MRTAFIDTLCQLAAEDERIWLLTGDLGYSVLERFATRFPERYVNVGVAEQNMVGVAAGLARCGKMPWVYSIANFPTFRCLEQIRNDVCYHNGNVKVVAVGAGFAYGPHGYTHHGLEDVAILRALPNMTVVAPADPVETRLATIAIANRHRHVTCGLERLAKQLSTSMSLTSSWARRFWSGPALTPLSSVRARCLRRHSRWPDAWRPLASRLA